MQNLDFMELGPHYENSRSVPCFCCHGNNYSHFNPSYSGVGAFHTFFEIFLAPLIFVNLECKFFIEKFPCCIYIFTYEAIAQIQNGGF